MFVDAHIHLSDEKYRENIREVIYEATQQRVSLLLAVSEDAPSSLRTMEIGEKFSSVVLPLVGLHPSFASKGDADLDKVREIISKSRQRVAGMGEIGLDQRYARGSSGAWQKQLSAFQTQLEMAEAAELPVNLHSRDTAGSIIAMLDSYQIKGAVFHWFAGDEKTMGKALDRGFYISFTPSITYSKRVRTLAKACVPELVLTETDGPVPFWGEFRGVTTRPPLVKRVVEELGDLMGLTAGDMARQVEQNAKRLFLGK